MDMSLLLQIILALIAIVPGTWALVNQRREQELKAKQEDRQNDIDEKQADINANLAAQQSLMGVIQPLQAEIARLHARGVELEEMLVVKTTENGQLRMDNIDKDSQLKALTYQYEGLQKRLLAMEESEDARPMVVTKEPTLPREVKLEMIANEEKKAQIAQETDNELQDIKNKSVTNGKTHPEGE